MLETSSDIMRYLAKNYFNGECFVTKEKFKDKGFVIHHLKYIENDVRREHYPKGEKGRLQYLKALKPMVEKPLTEDEKQEIRNNIILMRELLNKEIDRILSEELMRFTLIKNGIHTRIDHPRRGLSRLKRENFIRLVVAVLLTKK